MTANLAPIIEDFRRSRGALANLTDPSWTAKADPFALASAREELHTSYASFIQGITKIVNNWDSGESTGLATEQHVVSMMVMRTIAGR